MEIEEEKFNKINKKLNTLRNITILSILVIIILLGIFIKYQLDKKLTVRDQEKFFEGYNLCLQDVQNYFLSELTNKGYVSFVFNNQSINLLKENTCIEAIRRIQSQ